MKHLKNYWMAFLLPLLAACGTSKEIKEDPVVALFSKTTIASGKEYRNVDGISLLLDVYVPSKRLGEEPWVRYSDERKPTLLYFHGGGWRSGDKESRVMEILPYVDKGWVVVTANYRLLGQASLPEIIGDCRTALNWVYDHANQFKIDTSKIVLAGNSAGGHLALMTAMVKDDRLYKTEDIPEGRTLSIAAIVNWYGITEVSDFVTGWGDKQIISDNDTNLELVYEITSPIRFVDAHTPPVLTIHGSIDKIVPFNHAENLHRILDEKGVRNRLLKIENRKHGDFTVEEMTEIYKSIWVFLEGIGNAD